MARAPTIVVALLGGEEAVASLAKLLARNKPRHCVVKLKVPDGGPNIEVQLPGRGAITGETCQADLGDSQRRAC